MTVVTRFAPSPTGFLHIGGARTALFNWLFARHHGGKYLLRVEDTDKARSTEEAKHAILDGLAWLGLSPDEHTIFQSEREARHHEVAEKLLSEGKAYHCYCTPEELAQMREKAMEEGGPSYDRRWRNKSAADAPKGIAPTIRIKAPLDAPITINDAVQGDVTLPASECDDFIILRADGSPTYMHAVVVDDHDMGITHVIRGDDHLNNALRQAVIFDAMGWQRPTFAHIPLIHGPDGAKLSKRHGALGVEAYRDMGYLPEAIRNYLLRLGWSHGDEEIMSTEQSIEWFGLEAINKAPSRFDFDKLANVNGHYIREADKDTILPLLVPFVTQMLSRIPNEYEQSMLNAALPSLKERTRTLIDLANSCLFLFASPDTLDAKAQKALDQGHNALKDAIKVIESSTEVKEQALYEAFNARATELEQKLPYFMKPLRASLTGIMGGPSIFAIIEWLGREESLSRIETSLQKIAA